MNQKTENPHDDSCLVHIRQHLQKSALTEKSVSKWTQGLQRHLMEKAWLTVPVGNYR